MKLGANNTTIINTATTNTVQNYTTTVSQSSPPTTQHIGYTRRPRFRDSHSTGKLHTPNTHRSMTKLNGVFLILKHHITLFLTSSIYHVCLYFKGGSVGGLHKSLTRLSSSQQINQQSSTPQSNVTNTSGSSNVTSSTNHSKWTVGGLSSKGVIITTLSPSKVLRNGNSRTHTIQHSGQVTINQGTPSNMNTSTVVSLYNI